MFLTARMLIAHLSSSKPPSEPQLYSACYTLNRVTFHTGTGSREWVCAACKFRSSLASLPCLDIEHVACNQYRYRNVQGIYQYSCWLEKGLIAMYTHRIVKIWPALSSTLLSWAINTAATHWKMAAPSMLTVAPIGKINRLIRLSTPLFSSTHFIMVGSVAELHRHRTQKGLSMWWQIICNNGHSHSTGEKNSIITKF